MYITEALNHSVNGSPNNTPSQEVTNTTNTSFFEQMIATGSMQQTGSIAKYETAMNKEIQNQDDKSNINVVASNPEENKEEKANKYLGSPVSTTDMLSTIASFQRG